MQATDRDTAGGVAGMGGQLRRLWPLIAIALAALVLHARALGNPPLLDEQYLLTWLQELPRAEGGSFQKFLTWSGPNPADLTGVFANFYLQVSHALAFGQLFLMRFHCLLMHVAGACCLGLIAMKLTGRTALSLVAALIFLAAPLSWQALIWLGGVGSLVSTTCLLAAVFTYLTGRGRESTRWPFLAASVVFYLGALLSSSSSWYGALVIIFCELLAVPAQNKSEPPGRSISGQDLTTALMVPLLLVILTAAYFAGTGLVETMVALSRSPEPSLAALGIACKKTFMPVNEQIFLTGGAKRYLWMIVFTAPAALGFLSLLFRRRNLLMPALFSLLWLTCTWLPVLGHLPDNKTIFGDAAYYAGTAPLALLLALCLSGFSSLATIFFPKETVAVGNFSVRVVRFDYAVLATATLLLLGTYSRLVFKQQDFLRSAARNVSQLQKDGKQLAAAGSAPYVVITTMPSPLALSPLYNTAGVALFDGTGMLMSSPAVPGGRLKDAYRQGLLVNSSGRWQAALRKVFAVDLADSKNAWGQARTAADLGNLAIPNIVHNPLAKLDETEGVIILRSQPPAGPILTLNGMGLSPLEGDFMYIDARITGLTAGEPANIDFYWQTHEMDFYDAHLRKLAVKVDGQATDIHRYYIPLRTIGWTTNGPLLKLTLGFPPGSTVAIKEMGVIDSRGLMPTVNFVPPTAADGTRFANGFYKFPTLPALGLCAVPLSKRQATLTYDASNVHDAAGVTFEISLPNRPFGTANSSSLSGVTWKCLPADGAQGKFDLPIDDIPAPGLIYVRAIAMNSKHDFIGFFSDDLCFNITR